MIYIVSAHVAINELLWVIYYEKYPLWKECTYTKLEMLIMHLPPISKADHTATVNILLQSIVIFFWNFLNEGDNEFLFRSSLDATEDPGFIENPVSVVFPLAYCSLVDLDFNPWTSDRRLVFESRDRRNFWAKTFSP